MPDTVEVSASPVETVPAEPPRTIAILGEIPFSGAALTRVLLAKGFSVRVLCPDNRAVEALPKLSDPSDTATLEVIHGSLDSPEIIEQVLRGTFGAAFTSPITLNGRMYRANEHLEDVRRVVEAVRKSELKRFVYHSNLSANPASPSRALSHAAEAEGVVSSLKCNVFRVRSSLLMGRGDEFLSELAEKARASTFVMGIWGYGGTMIQPMYVDDMARCVLAVFEKSSVAPGVVNVAGPEITTPLELVDSILHSLGKIKVKLHAPLFMLKLFTMLGTSADFKEEVNLLLEVFCTDQNDTVKLLGSTCQLVTPRQSQEEIMSGTCC